MKKKQFKAESKKLLDLMINSIYTHKEIFLRELISNASDAIDKLYYKALTDGIAGINRDDFFIRIDVDKEARTLTIRDNGIGMTAEEMESNLGTIARSGSLDFKSAMEGGEGTAEVDKIDIIGQFGVGFYSAFMVSDKVVVKSRAYGSEEANCWTSEGADGFTMEPCEKEGCGTEITLYVKADTENERYSEYLEKYKLSGIIRKYSDYISYPIKMEMDSSKLKEGSEDEYETVTEIRTMNSMVPLWRKSKSEISQEEYNSFYHEKFFDFTEPAKVIHSKTEGQVSYDALLFIPKKPPFDYYTKEYEKGLQLYANGVMIMEKCGDLLPDYFSFVKGLVDSSDLSLNISREMLQQDHQMKLIEKNVEKKIRSELEKMMESDRETYEEFFKSFGVQIKFGVYDGYGMHAKELADLLLFWSSTEKKMVSLKDYVSRMKEDQKVIYYAPGETNEKIDMLPQADAVREKGFEVLYMTQNVDEFAIQMLREYDGKSFTNICSETLDLASEEEKEALKKENEDAKDLLSAMKEALGEAVNDVRFTNKLKNHPVCLSSEGGLSVAMEQALNEMPTEEKVKAQIILEINDQHAIAGRLKALYADDKEKLKEYAKILYVQARLIGGMSVEDPAEFCGMVCDLMV